VKKFTKAHRRALEEYAVLTISLEELRERLAGVVEFDFQNNERRLDSHYGTPVPGVRIVRKLGDRRDVPRFFEARKIRGQAGLPQFVLMRASLSWRPSQKP